MSNENPNTTIATAHALSYLQFIQDKNLVKPSKAASQLSRWLEGSIFSRINEAFYIPYYCSMIVCAASYLRILLNPLVIGLMHLGLPISMCFSILWCCIGIQLIAAFYNEAIEVMVQCGETKQVSHELIDKRLSGKQQNKTTVRYLMLMIILVSFAIIHDFSTTWTMVSLQLQDLGQVTDLPDWFKATYRVIFLTSGVAALGMLQMANVSKYLTKYLLPGCASQSVSPSNCTNSKPQQPSILRSILQHATRIYLKHSAVMIPSMLAGAFLYAYADYMQLYGGLILFAMLFANPQTIALRVLVGVASYAKPIALLHGFVCFVKKIQIWCQNARALSSDMTARRPAPGQPRSSQLSSSLLARCSCVFYQIQRKKAQSGENWWLFLIPRNQHLIHTVAKIRYATKAVFGIVSTCLIASGNVYLGIGAIIGFVATELMKVFVQGLSQRPSQLNTDYCVFYTRGKCPKDAPSNHRYHVLSKDIWEHVLLLPCYAQEAKNRLRHARPSFFKHTGNQMPSAKQKA